MLPDVYRYSLIQQARSVYPYSCALGRCPREMRKERRITGTAMARTHAARPDSELAAGSEPQLSYSPPDGPAVSVLLSTSTDHGKTDVFVSAIKNIMRHATAADGVVIPKPCQTAAVIDRALDGDAPLHNPDLNLHALSDGACARVLGSTSTARTAQAISSIKGKNLPDRFNFT